MHLLSNEPLPSVSLSYLKFGLSTTVLLPCFFSQTHIQTYILNFSLTLGIEGMEGWGVRENNKHDVFSDLTATSEN